MQPYEDELSLRDLVLLLRRKQRWIWLFTFLSLLVGAVYAFVIAKPVYESSVVFSVSPLKVKAQLEEKIQLQQRGLLTFEGLKALAFSQENLARTLELARKNSASWPESWEGLDKATLLARLQEKLSLANKTAKTTSPSEPPTLIAVQKARVGDPALAAALANAWAKVTAQMVNDLPARQLKANLRALAEQIAPAEAAYRKAQKAWEGFQKETNLAEWKKELAQRISEKVSIQSQVQDLERHIQEKKARLEELKKQLARERQNFAGKVSPTELAFVNRSLSEAKAFIQKQYEAAAKAFAEATAKLVTFQSKTPLDRWKAELVKYRNKAASVELRLRELATERAKLKTKLRTVEAALQRTPQTLVLRREVTADPVTGLAAARDLEALRGLKLENETLYGVYTDLEKRRNSILVELDAMATEEEALAKERDRLRFAIDDLRSKLSKAQAEMERLDLETKIAKTRYEGWRKLAEEYKQVSGNLAFENPDPVYQKLRAERLSLEVELRELRTRLAGLKNQLAYDEKRIGELRAKVAAAELQADRLQENLRLTKETYLALKQKQTDLKIELASLQNSLAQVLSPAYPIPEPVAPRKMLILALSGFLGLMLGVFAAFLSAALEPPPNPQSA